MFKKFAKASLVPFGVLFALIILELIAIAIILPNSARAHEAAPSEIVLRQLTAGSISVSVALDPTVSGAVTNHRSDHSEDSDLEDLTTIGARVLNSLKLTASGTSAELKSVGIEQASASRPNFLMTADIPLDATTLSISPGAFVGDSIIRYVQSETQSVPKFVTGASTETFTFAGSEDTSLGKVVANYLHAGIIHIVPKGLDHILFVVGLFLLTPAVRPLLLQVSLFTAAHTLTLALGASGLIFVPGIIVEPLIAASIVFVAAENIMTKDLSRWRPLVVFAFGLMHGLGFAGVMTEFGLPESHFLAGLVAFNIGVELGQIFVLAVCFGAVGLWFAHKAWYRIGISIPASVLVATTGAVWTVQRLGDVL